MHPRLLYKRSYNGSQLDRQHRDQLKLTMYPELPYIRLHVLLSSLEATTMSVLGSYQLHSEHPERTFGPISAKC